MNIEQQQVILIDGSAQPVSKTDIVCARGRTFVNHPGNIRFKTIIKSSVQRYLDAKTSIDRTYVIASILSDINESGARFIKKDRNINKWFVLGDNDAHNKIGHSIRDLIARSKKNETNTKKNSPKSKNNENATEKTSLKAINETTTTPSSCGRSSLIEPICYRICRNMSETFDMTTTVILNTVLDVDSIDYEDNQMDQEVLESYDEEVEFNKNVDYVDYAI